MKNINLSRFSIQHLWSLTVLVGIFIFLNTHPIRPQDFWWHIAIGREIISTHEIPEVDVYSYTVPGEPYPSYQMYWLMEVILYALYNFGGPALVVFFQSVIITSSYAILLLLCRRLTGSWRLAAFGTLFSAVLGFNDWNVRPQAVTFLIGVVFLLAIDCYRQQPRTLWLAVFPLGMLVWVNSHGTFVIGLLLLGIWLAAEAWGLIKQSRTEAGMMKRKSILAPFLAVGLTGLTCLVNPRGLGIIFYLSTLTGNSVVQNLVPEWTPPTFDTLIGSLFLSGLLFVATILALSPRRPQVYELLIFLVFAGLALRTGRGIVWFGLVMAPILSVHFAALSKGLEISGITPLKPGYSERINRIFLGLLGIMIVVTIPWFKPYLPMPLIKAGLISIETPIAATQFLLEEKPSGQVFHSISFGSYLIWAAYPDYRVFVDPRIELYPTEIWLDYLRISNAQGNWQGLLDAYGVQVLLLSPIEQPVLIRAVRASTDWQQVYQDPAAEIFIK